MILLEKRNSKNKQECTKVKGKPQSHQLEAPAAITRAKKNSSGISGNPKLYKITHGLGPPPLNKIKYNISDEIKKIAVALINQN